VVLKKFQNLHFVLVTSKQPARRPDLNYVERV
jgi:hypothetical protein